MKIRFADRGLAADATQLVLVDAASGWQGPARRFDDASGGQLRRACQVTGFKARSGEICEVIAPQGLEAARILVVGTGAGWAADVSRFETLGGTLCAELLKRDVTDVTIDFGALEAAPELLANAAARLAFGLRLRAYRFDKYRGVKARRPLVSRVDFSGVPPTQAREAFQPFDALVTGIFFARDLVSEPPNELFPKSFVARARKELAGQGVHIEVLGERKLRELGFGALLGVSQGSAFEPQVLICEYDGTRGKRKTQPLVLAGKGVTFDAGGISIKPSAGLETLKQDMGGAASIVGVLKTLALRKARCRVIGICGLVENMPSGTAQRPGDVVKSLSGKTIEIINTDAEGRLVLCDLLWYAQERYRPKVLIDMATLTGAIAIALGESYAGLFTNDDALAAQLVAAGESTGDRLWRYPMGEAYDRHLDSLIADVKNIGPDKGRSIIAAQFIQRFVQPGVSWAHVDFGMRVWAEKETALAPEGATGFGVRLLDRLIADHFEA